MSRFRDTTWTRNGQNSRDTFARPDLGERRNVTVCIAAAFKWNHAHLGQADDFAPAILTVSDRMITAFDIEYEPMQTKVAFVSQRCVILIAGEYSVHSQAINNTRRQTGPNSTIENVADIYGREIQKLKQRHAEDIYLSPFGLNTDTFIAQQKEMASGFIDRLSNQIQEYPGAEVEAIVAGCSDDRAHIYQIDRRGVVSCLDDIGYAAIGIGAWHAKSRFMQSRYTNALYLAPALATAYAAKRNAEIAPGVGKHDTDINFITRDGWLRIWPRVAQQLLAGYDQYAQGRGILEQIAIDQLQAAIMDPHRDEPKTQQQSEPVGRRAQANESAGSTAAETTSGNEVRQDKPEGAKE